MTSLKLIFSLVLASLLIGLLPNTGSYYQVNAATCTVEAAKSGGTTTIRVSGITSTKELESLFLVGNNGQVSGERTLDTTNGSASWNFDDAAWSQNFNATPGVGSSFAVRAITGTDCGGGNNVQINDNLSPLTAFEMTQNGEEISTLNPCSDPSSAEWQSVACNRAACEGLRDQVPGLFYIQTFDTCTTLMDFIQTLLNFFLTIAAVIAGFMFLQSGYRILTSQGSPAAVAEGREQLTNAIVGIILVALAYALINFLDNALNLIPGAGINLLGPFRRT